MIWILPYDPFGDDCMLYTVKNTVVENHELVYNDGVLKLFLYTKGKKGGSEELKALLTYFENTTQDNAVDEELKAIQEIVGAIKCSKETGERYMTLQEYIDYEKEYGYRDGFQRGMQHGMQEGMQQGIQQGMQQGMQQGIQQAIQQGIQGIIQTCQSLKQTKEKTIEILMERCSLIREDAVAYIELYWKNEISN